MSAREVVEGDLSNIKVQIALDPTHSQDENFTPEVFLNPATGNYVLGDEQGPVMYVSFAKEVRCTIQFCNVDKDRVKATFAEYLPKFMEQFKSRHYVAATYTAGIGDTGLKPTVQSRALALFLRVFGFKKEESQRKVL